MRRLWAEWKKPLIGFVFGRNHVCDDLRGLENLPIIRKPNKCDGPCNKIYENQQVTAQMSPVLELGLPFTLATDDRSALTSDFYDPEGTHGPYGIPWQVLAAINEVETDYGRDLSVSSAGAEGWMQFLPSSWAQYGVDANGDGFKDPYNPADAIFAAARYLKAAGGDTDIRGAVYSYNHSQAYVDSVLLRAQLLGGTPPELLGAITDRKST